MAFYKKRLLFFINYLISFVESYNCRKDHYNRKPEQEYHIGIYGMQEELVKDFFGDLGSENNASDGVNAVGKRIDLRECRHPGGYVCEREKGA